MGTIETKDTVTAPAEKPVEAPKAAPAVDNKAAEELKLFAEKCERIFREVKKDIIGIDFIANSRPSKSQRQIICPIHGRIVNDPLLLETLSASTPVE